MNYTKTILQRNRWTIVRLNYQVAMTLWTLLRPTLTWRRLSEGQLGLCCRLATWRENTPNKPISVTMSTKYVSLPVMSDVCLTFTMQFYNGLHGDHRNFLSKKQVFQSLSSIKIDFTYMCHFVVENWPIENGIIVLWLFCSSLLKKTRYNKRWFKDR